MATATAEKKGPTAMQVEALERAQNGNSIKNEQIVIEAFMARGFAEEDIIPRENVLTFHAWKAKGRVVCKGEKSVKVETWVPVITTDEDGNEHKSFRRRSAAVFHISQTKEL